MNNIQIRSDVWKEEDYFVAQCLDVDVSSFGDTKEEALANLKEALDLYFEG
jgi:predicted RNase H-like HicB family nuclease